MKFRELTIRKSIWASIPALAVVATFIRKNDDLVIVRDEVVAQDLRCLDTVAPIIAGVRKRRSPPWQIMGFSEVVEESKALCVLLASIVICLAAPATTWRSIGGGSGCREYRSR